MVKTLIAPIIGALALVVQLLLGVEIPKEVLDQLIFVVGNLVAICVTIYGIVKPTYIKKFRKKDKEI
jgi:hypothetical protein